MRLRRLQRSGFGASGGQGKGCGQLPLLDQGPNEGSKLGFRSASRAPRVDLQAKRSALDIDRDAVAAGVDLRVMNDRIQLRVEKGDKIRAGAGQLTGRFDKAGLVKLIKNLLVAVAA